MDQDRCTHNATPLRVAYNDENLVEHFENIRDFSIFQYLLKY